jgi:hypothetical protein
VGHSLIEMKCVTSLRPWPGPAVDVMKPHGLNPGLNGIVPDGFWVIWSVPPADGTKFPRNDYRKTFARGGRRAIRESNAWAETRGATRSARSGHGARGATLRFRPPQRGRWSLLLETNRHRDTRVPAVFSGGRGPYFEAEVTAWMGNDFFVVQGMGWAFVWGVFAGVRKGPWGHQLVALGLCISGVPAGRVRVEIRKRCRRSLPSDPVKGPGHSRRATIVFRRGKGIITLCLAMFARISQ